MNTTPLLGRALELACPLYPTSRLSAGRSIAGKYSVRGVLGEGGFAVVYQAEHLSLGCPVAIKVMHISAHTTRDMLAQFREEARITAAVQHPNVVDVHDTGTLEDGSPYLVMAYLAGETLHARLARGGLPLGEVFQVAEQLVCALRGLSERGVIHCDLKPKNVLLCRTKTGQLRVKLVDFGIAKATGANGHALSTTGGAVLGTPHYMSPEHLRGEELDVRTDIYALGVVLYELLTGQLPHRGDSLDDLLCSIGTTRVRPVRAQRSDCPPAFERIVMRCLEPERVRRYQDAHALWIDLQLCREAFRKHLRKVDEGERSALMSEHRSPVGRRVSTGLRSLFGKRLRLMAAALSFSTGLIVSTGRSANILAGRSSTAVAHDAEKVEGETYLGRSHSLTPAGMRLLQAADELYLRGRSEDALLLYSAAATLHPENANVWRGITALATTLHREEEARLAFGRNVHLAPEAPDLSALASGIQALAPPQPALSAGAR